MVTAHSESGVIHIGSADSDTPNYGESFLFRCTIIAFGFVTLPAPETNGADGSIVIFLQELDSKLFIRRIGFQNLWKVRAVTR
jgi:hypothetical protein